MDPATGMLSGPVDEEMAANTLWKEILENKRLQLNTPYVIVINDDDDVKIESRKEAYCDYLW